MENKKEIVKRLLKPGNSLGERAIKGGLWVFSLRIVGRIFQLARIIVLARLLSPNDFGLFGIALLVLSTLETFSQTGFMQALIQKKEDTKPYLDTVWTVGLIRGFLIAAILFFAAPYVAIFFKSPPAEPILKVIGLAIILHSLTNIAVIYFEKELEFHKYFTYQFAGIIVDVTVAISAAFLLRSVWALVFGLLAGNLVRCIASYLIDTYRPRLYFDFPKAKDLIEYGKWILGSSILIFLVTQGDSIFVGKLLGVTMLGFYQIAYRISNMPATEITHIISQVTFPAYSKLQDSIYKLRKAYLKVLQVTAFLSFLIAGLIFILAPDFTKIFLGERWMPIVPVMRVLVFVGLVRSIAATAGFIFYAVGKPKIDTKLQIVRLLVMVFLIYPLTIKWGILGLSTTVFLSIFISTIGFSFYVIKITRCEIKDFSKTLAIPLINGGIVILFIYVLKIIAGNGMWQFIMFICTGVLTYFIMAYLTDKFLKYKMQALIKETFQSLRSA